MSVIELEFNYFDGPTRARDRADIELRMRRSGCCARDPMAGAGAADITIVRAGLSSSWRPRRRRFLFWFYRVVAGAAEPWEPSWEPWGQLRRRPACNTMVRERASRSWSPPPR
jgi:hypothetical protein